MSLFTVKYEHRNEHIDRSTDTIEVKTKKDISALEVLIKFAKKKEISLSYVTSNPMHHKSYASARYCDAGDVVCDITVTRKTQKDIPPRINL